MSCGATQKQRRWLLGDGQHDCSLRKPTRMMSSASFVAERRTVALRLMREFPDRVPVSLWLARAEEEAELRLLVAKELTVAHLALFLRQLLQLGSLSASATPLFLWARGRPLPPLHSFATIAQTCRETDGFVHLLATDMGGPLATAPPPTSTRAAAARATAPAPGAAPRPRVAFYPRELEHSFPPLRYPSPPEPPIRPADKSPPREPSTTRVSRSASEATAFGSASASFSSPGYVSKNALPALRVTSVAAVWGVGAPPPGQRAPQPGHPRALPPRDLGPPIPPPPPPAAVESVDEELLASRGAGPPVSDDEEPVLRLDAGVRQDLLSAFEASAPSVAPLATALSVTSARQLFQGSMTDATKAADETAAAAAAGRAPKTMADYEPSEDAYGSVTMTTASLRVPSWIRTMPKSH